MKFTKFLLALPLLMSYAHAMLPNPSTTEPQAQFILADEQIPSRHQDVQSTLHAFLFEGDTLSPITPDTPLKAGDIIEYHAYISNHTKERIRSVNVSFDIPAGVELIEGFSPMVSSASLDGNRFFPAPLRVNIDGQTQPIPLSQYKALQWRVQDIGIDGVAIVKFRVKLI